MKRIYCLFGLIGSAILASADTLPIITSNPSDLSGSGVFSVVSPNATDYQWRYNGTDIPDATNSTLARTTSDPAGYYMAIVKNSIGHVPSQLAYLSRGTGGYVPFSNYGNQNWMAVACYQATPTFGGQGQPVFRGTAQVCAGPELDRMHLVGDIYDFAEWGPDWFGIYDWSDQLVPDVSPGQTVYYSVNLTYPIWSGSYTQPSRTLKMIAGGGSYPTPSSDGIRFPLWPEWPEPWWLPASSSPTNQVRVPGETVTLSSAYLGYQDFGIPTIQWRKDGQPIPGATNFSYVVLLSDLKTAFTITNFQAANAGIYDVEVFGNRYMIAPTFTVKMQLANGTGLLQSPRIDGMNLVCDLQGAPGRSYLVQWSPDLLQWNNLFTRSNSTGSLSFTNPLSTDVARFYRAKLLP